MIVAIVRLKVSPSPIADSGAPLLSDAALAAFTDDDLPELILPSTLSLSTVEEYLEVCRENKSEVNYLPSWSLYGPSGRTYPMRTIPGEDLPLGLADVDVKQDAKDMNRDMITVSSGRAVPHFPMGFPIRSMVSSMKGRMLGTMA